MNKITLICTEHEEKGACNSQELYRIIGKVEPEVVFEEIPPCYFDSYYKAKSRRNLESDTINWYLESHHVEHIPVDLNDIPEDIFEKNGYMHRRVEASSVEYRNLIDSHSSYVYWEGFRYLNGTLCSNLYKEVYDAIRRALGRINDERLIETFNLWNDVMEKREIEMLRNIYAYSKQHQYERGIFLIGAAHRQSVINRINDLNNSANEKIGWNYTDYEAII